MEHTVLRINNTNLRTQQPSESIGSIAFPTGKQSSFHHVTSLADDPCHTQDAQHAHDFEICQKLGFRRQPGTSEAGESGLDGDLWIIQERHVDTCCCQGFWLLLNAIVNGIYHHEPLVNMSYGCGHEGSLLDPAVRNYQPHKATSQSNDIQYFVYLTLPSRGNIKHKKVAVLKQLESKTFRCWYSGVWNSGKLPKIQRAHKQCQRWQPCFYRHVWSRSHRKQPPALQCKCPDIPPQCGSRDITCCISYNLKRKIIRVLSQHVTFLEW